MPTRGFSHAAAAAVPIMAELLLLPLLLWSAAAGRVGATNPGTPTPTPGLPLPLGPAPVGNPLLQPGSFLLAAQRPSKQSLFDFILQCEKAGKNPAEAFHPTLTAPILPMEGSSKAFGDFFAKLEDTSALSYVQTKVDCDHFYAMDICSHMDTMEKIVEVAVGAEELIHGLFQQNGLFSEDLQNKLEGEWLCWLMQIISPGALFSSHPTGSPPARGGRRKTHRPHHPRPPAHGGGG